MVENDHPEDLGTHDGRPIGVPFDDLGVSGLLTRSDREFLIGEKTYDDPVDERKARQRLRTRIRNGLLDFVLLAHHLEPRDRTQLLGDVTAQLPDEVYRDDEVEGMIYAIAFLYATAHDAGLPFDRVVEQGIDEAREKILTNPFAFRNVKVEIDETPTTNLDRIVEKIEADDELTGLEIRSVKSWLFSDLDRFLEATEHIEIPRQEYYEAGETLSIGKSLVRFGRGLENARIMDREVDGEVLHEHVRKAFGLEQFL